MYWINKINAARRRFRAKAPPGFACLLSAALCAAVLAGTPACASGSAAAPTADDAAPPAADAGLFSWGAEEVNKTDGKLFSLMKQEGLNVLYQNFSTDNSRQEQMAAFLERAMEEDIRVYHLDGDPSWGLDPEGASLCKAVEAAAAYNRRTARKFLAWREQDGRPWDAVPRLAGVMLDVEPYLLKDWDKNPGKVMRSFVSGMKKAYALAQEHDLEVLLCVPWYYDSKDQEKQLEELIKSCCDGIAVMNYYRGAEIKNIALEVELTAKYEKDLITIYELKEADGQSVKEVNTYYNAGLAAARENYASLTAAYPEQVISAAFHDYRALKEVLKK